jgi:hypothetical protein
MKTAAELYGGSVYSPGSALGYPRAFVPDAAPCPAFVEVEPPIILRQNLLLESANRLAILLPSRGQIFSRAMESILREARSCTRFRHIALFMSHGLPIPQTQQQLVRRALEWKADVTWLVEEDNYMPPGVLNALCDALKEGNQVVSCAYFNHEGSDWVISPSPVENQLHAFGCTLVDSAVWRAIGEPYCTLGKRIGGNGEYYAYGGQDIAFSQRLHELGIKSTALDGSMWRCGHLHLEKAGDRKSNESGVSVVKIV